MIKQNKSEDLSTELNELLSYEFVKKNTEAGIITFVKKKKVSDTSAHCVRLTPKGLALLEDLETPEVLEEDLAMFNWLEAIYKGYNKEIGNRKKTKIYISLFRAQSGINKNKLAYLCKTFIEDEKEFEWSFKLEFLFLKPSNVFSVKFDLEQSRLWQYYLKNKEKFETVFNTLKK